MCNCLPSFSDAEMKMKGVKPSIFIITLLLLKLINFYPLHVRQKCIDFSYRTFEFVVMQVVCCSINMNKFYSF